jgi:hypothetical protein
VLKAKCHVQVESNGIEVSRRYTFIDTERTLEPLDNATSSQRRMNMRYLLQNAVDRHAEYMKTIGS